MSGNTLLFQFDQTPPERLDIFLTDQMEDLSRSRIQSLIKNGLVLVNGIPAGKTGIMLETGDHISVEIPDTTPTTFVPEAIPLSIVYEDENVIVVDKPAGMVVHPSAGHPTGTLVHAILAHAPGTIHVGGVERPGVVHRLDKDTSGILLFAKNDAAHQWLQMQFKNRKVEKSYLALVEGHPPTPVGRIEAPIGRDPKDRLRMTVLTEENAKPATTIYKTIQRYRDYSYLQVDILTGRTHQIRVHMKFLGCPVAGDALYGRKRSKLKLDRQFLHAAHLGICLPGQTEMTQFDSPLPQDLQDILQHLA